MTGPKYKVIWNTCIHDEGRMGCRNRRGQKNWGCNWIKKVLTRGPVFRFTLPKLNDHEKEIVINRTVTSMTVKIRMNLIKSRSGKPMTQAQTWEIDKGLRIGSHKMRWFLLKVIPRVYEELQGTILKNSLAREFEERDETWDEQNMTQHIEGDKWGLGEIIKERRDKAGVTPNSQMKIYK